MFRMVLVLGLAMAPACQFDRSGVQPWETGAPELALEDASTPAKLDLPTVSLTGDGLLPCGPGSCAGCCRGDVCQPGDDPDGCGTGGVACSDCRTAGKVCTAGACVPCSSSLECHEETVCHKKPIGAEGGTCVSPWNRTWRVLVVSAEIDCVTNAWDWGLSFPDPFVTIRSGGASWTTDTKQDSCKPEWKQYVEIQLQPGTPLSFEVRDQNPVGSAPIGTFALAQGVSITLLKLGVIQHLDPSPMAKLLRLTIALIPAP